MPLLLTAHRLSSPPEASSPARGVLGSYSKLWRDLVTGSHRDRNLVLTSWPAPSFATAWRRITFGGVLGVNAYGISPADVLIFGVAASVVAALGAVFGGFLDDRIGSKPVIIGSLACHHRVGPGHDGCCPVRARSGSPDCCCACSSGRPRRRRARCCCGCPATGRRAWPSGSTR